MGNPIQKRYVVRSTIASASAAITTTQPVPIQIKDEFQVGDCLLKRLLIDLRFALSLTASGAGTIITRGGLQFLRSLRFETDKHGMIVDGLDGIALHNIQTVRKQARPYNSDIDSAATGTPSAAYGLEIALEDPDAVRPEDSALDLHQARPQLSLEFGVVTDFISGGTYSVESCDSGSAEIHADYDPGPMDVVKDGPLAMPYYGILKVPVSQTESQKQILLSYGDRNIRRLYIFQRNGSTLAELNNTVLGANATDRVSLKVNGYPWVDRICWRALQAENANECRLSAMPSGMGFFDFTRRRAGGFKYSDALSVVSQRIGNIELLVDVTSVSNGQLWIVYEALKPLPPAALRPGPVAKAG